MLMMYAALSWTRRFLHVVVERISQKRNDRSHDLGVDFLQSAKRRIDRLEQEGPAI